MENLNQNTERKDAARIPLPRRLGKLAAEARERRRRDKTVALVDLIVMVVAALASRTHVVFGSHPIAIGMIAVLPTRVVAATFGAVVGALTLGRSGIIYAMISLIVLFLRMIVSGDRSGESPFFSEGLTLRMSAALIGGFTAAIYEVLLSGFSLAAILFGTAMVLIPPVVTLLLSGLFDPSLSAVRSGLLRGGGDVLSLRSRGRGEGGGVIFFQISALVLTLLISLSLAEYVILGINLSYIYSSLVTLLAAKRFGALRGAAVGFASAVGLSSLYSVAFALAGLVAGALSPFGSVWAMLAGGAALGGWCAYAGGVGGFLSTFPEYVSAALISTPLFARISAVRSEVSEDSEGRAKDVLGTAALAYRSSFTGALDSLAASLTSLSSVIGKYKEGRGLPTEDELAKLIGNCARDYCSTCSSCGICTLERGIPEHLLRSSVSKLRSGGELVPSDLCDDGGCGREDGLSASVNRATALLREEKYRAFMRDTTAEHMAVTARLIKEARAEDDAERRLNDALTETVTKLLPEHGLAGGAAMVLGSERPHIMVAAEDADGALISSPALRSALADAVGMPIGKPEYYKSGRIALLECSTAPRLGALCSIVSRPGGRDEVSGDVAVTRTCEDGRFFALISDGMGSGSEARATAKLTADFLLSSLENSPSDEAVLRLLNLVIRSESEECSATVDLFSLDPVSGSASFIKSGAAPSYIKRGSSLFRIRSRTVPLGVMREVDAERIRAEVCPGDMVIMMSDGVSPSVEDTPWLPELLSRSGATDPARLAEQVMEAALASGNATDDMTVAVTKIFSIPDENTEFSAKID